MDDKTQDKWLKILWGNQEQILKNQATYWDWIRFLDKEIKAQSTFDDTVTKSLQDHESKLVSVIELVREVKELKQQLAKSPRNSSPSDRT